MVLAWPGWSSTGVGQQLVLTADNGQGVSDQKGAMKSWWMRWESLKV